MRTALNRYYIPEFYIGRNALELTSSQLIKLKSQKTLIVTDPGLKAVGLIDRLEKQLRKSELNYVIFDHIKPNPRDREVMEGAEFYRKERCDAILSIGGGSPTDAAKGIGIAVTNDLHINKFEGVDQVENPMPPMVCIPTTAGTAADISQFSIILNTLESRKIAIISKSVVPNVSLIDAETTLTKDQELTAATGIDALVHAIEAYVSTSASAVTDMNALEAIRLINQYLPLVLSQPDNLYYRQQMMAGSLLAGMAFSNASLGLVHAMSHALGGLKDAPHGMCNAILLDPVVNYNYEACPERYNMIARMMGVDIDDNASFDMNRILVLERIKEFKYECGINQGLTALGVKDKEINALAQKAQIDPCAITNPQPSDVKSIEWIYTNAK